jgi:ribosomal protein S12 methylthiotransferase
MKKRLINVISLGCSKNLVDSEYLMAQLRANHFQVVHNSVDPGARTVVINTCGFIQDAKQESIDIILEQIRAKEKGEIDQVFVMGCLSERYLNILKKEIPEADGFVGVNNLPEVIRLTGGVYKRELVGERHLTTPSHYAYLKVSEGCDRTCSFCAIPLIRGPHRSRPMEDIISEARRLVSVGVKEIILIAQDLTYYGLDLYKKQVLADLLEKLAEINGLAWIRLHYAYPASFPVNILKVIRERDNICKYLDIPFQHASDRVLKSMRRGISSRQTAELIDRIKGEIPGLALRTTVMVGHPGEEEKDFELLLEFVRINKFDRLGSFAYSEEEDTYSAKHFADSIPTSVKEERLARVMELQQDISLEKNILRIGQGVRTLIDRKETGFYTGHTEFDSPEVDNEVIIRSDKVLNTGEFYTVKIIEAEPYDLTGEIPD